MWARSRRCPGSWLRRQGGFTLIELLVVISIIALLMAILLPALSGARAQGRLITCLANMRSCGQAAMVFVNDHDLLMQLVSSEEGVKRADVARRKFAYGSGIERELLCWPVALAQAAGFPQRDNWDWGVRANSFWNAREQRHRMDSGLGMFLCPSDRVRIATPYYPRYEGSNQGLKGDGDPGNPRPPDEENLAYWGYLSYGINEDVTGSDGGVPACWTAVQAEDGSWVGCRGSFHYPPATPCGRDRRGRRLRGNMDRIYAPSGVGLIFEAGPQSVSQPGSMLPWDEFANLVISEAAEGPYLGDAVQQFPSRIPTRRHIDERLNVVFADMHGETVRPGAYGTDNFYGRELPSAYVPRVRVSPYPAHEID